SDSHLPLSPDFLQRLQEFYDATAQILDPGDPGAADRINQWVNSTTRGRIEALLRREDLASGIGCILTNAIYFKGLWLAPFAPDATCAMSFELPDGRYKNGPMMHQSGQFPYLETAEFQAIELAYSGTSASMYIVLPHPGIALNMAPWEAWLPQFQPSAVHLSLPRFALTYEQDMKEPLRAQGLDLVF